MRPLAPALVSLCVCAAPAAALTETDLQAQARLLEAGDAQQRLTAALAVAKAPPEGLPLYAAWLKRPQKAQDVTVRALIHAIWGQYPNPDYPKGPGADPPLWFVRPEPRWVPPPRVPGQPRAQRPQSHDPEAVDWLTALAALDLDKEPLLAPVPPGERVLARGELLLRVALMRAIAAAGQAGRREAVMPLFELAFQGDGLLRDECGRTIRSIGSYAVPTLIRIYNDRTRANAQTPKMRRYASYQLDRMDRLRPVQAVATAPDDPTRAEIIHAYGEARALDAVEAVLSQVDATSHRVRREARWAWMRYVDGPPPPPAPKRKRKLPGGATEAEEKEDYLNYREMATLALQKKLQEELGRPPAAELSAKQLTTQLLALYDQRRENEYAQLFEAARGRERAGDLEGAVNAFGFILAHQPDHPRRVDMAAGYRRLGDQLQQQGQLGRAVGLLRTALALDPQMPEARAVLAQVHYVDGLQAEAQGGSGEEDYAQALAQDATFAPAREALQRLHKQQAARRTYLPLGVTGLGLLAALLGFLLWGLWRRDRRGHDLPHSPSPC